MIPVMLKTVSVIVGILSAAVGSTVAVLNLYKDSLRPTITLVREQGATKETCWEAFGIKRCTKKAAR